MSRVWLTPDITRPFVAHTTTTSAPKLWPHATASAAVDRTVPHTPAVRGGHNEIARSNCGPTRGAGGSTGCSAAHVRLVHPPTLITGGGPDDCNPHGIERPR